MQGNIQSINKDEEKNLRNELKMLLACEEVKWAQKAKELWACSR